ncbi:MAG: transposase [Faecousia sp.]
MASRYKFSNEEIKEIEKARKDNKDKRAEARLKALELRAKGAEASAVAEATGFHAAYVCQLVAKYRKNGLEAISGNHYGGNHHNLSFEEETEILAPFKARAEKGELVEVSEIETAYRQAVGHSIGTSQIYYVLHRHGWRKVMPRSRHPQKASEEVIETSKKLKPKLKN